LTVVSLGTFLSQTLGPRSGLLSIVCLSVISGCIAYYLFLIHIIAPLSNIILALIFSYLGILGMRLTREEKERLHLERIFTPYVSESVLTEIMNSTKRPSLGGEELEITALFSDIRNFTTISEKLSPKEVVEMLNIYYSRICDLITSQGGIVDTFSGDGVMAVFGAPIAHLDHASRGLKAALSLIDASNSFQDWINERFPDRDIPEFKIGVGLNTGRALIGNIGSMKRMVYTAIGDTVNVASRLEGLCKEFNWSIVASQTTVDAAGEAVVLNRKETVKPRGRTGNLNVFEVLGVKNFTVSNR